MTPDYFEGTMERVADKHGEERLLPAGYCDAEETVVDTETGWFARLSASGYLDCTEWAGPFASEAEARKHIEDTYDVDPDTGDDLAEEEEADSLEST